MFSIFNKKKPHLCYLIFTITNFIRLLVLIHHTIIIFNKKKNNLLSIKK